MVVDVANLSKIARIFFIYSFTVYLILPTSCQRKDEGVTLQDRDHSKTKYGREMSMRYLLYDVNYGEGFNLRRDVYLRLSTLIKNLNKEEPWTLVVPPWDRIYHWRSEIQQSSLPWSTFFDMESMNQYIPVIEFEDFYERTGGVIDELYYLQRYAEGWDGTWVEKMHERPCLDEQNHYAKDKSGHWRSYFWNYEDVYAKKFKCISIQGHASFIIPFLRKNSTGSSVFIDRAETLLHDYFGNEAYWMGRRSMRFAKHLRDVGDKFRAKYLDSTDEKDNTIMDPDWRQMKRHHGDAKGGPYISVHLRRADFLYSRNANIPSINGAAMAIKELLKKNKLTKVFVATDGTEQDYSELKTYLKNYEVFRYKPTRSELDEYKDGGVAIIDQWICAHARYFIGSYESTFSFRIQDEREILGFKPETTFNRFCGDKEKDCEQPAQWKIVY